jgi:serine/threonine protein kinase
MGNPQQSTTEKSPNPVSAFLSARAAENSDQESEVARLAEEMIEAWRKGERPGAELYLARCPGLGSQPAAVMDLLYEEIRLRHEYGEPLDAEEIATRFPGWRQQIEILIPCVHTMETGVMGGFPVAGEIVGEFHLLVEIGRGGQGRVFIATQSSLGDRPVVVKITPRGGHEHLSLARLQHTHIVPLLSVLDEPDRNLRVLCMPYFGGLTLAAVLAALKDRPHDQRTGQQILEVLDQARTASPVSLPTSRDPATPFLSRATYIQAIGWLGACLAEALKYAHERGLLHLDLKPSNVLVTGDRQPMLLDFHLARGPLCTGDAGKRLGGTPTYMSPEQKQAMAALREGNPIPEAIDARSDIYSLGLVLYEALGGNVDDADEGVLVSLHRRNLQVPPGLSDIIAKCLAREAKNRYRDAGAVASDLWGHLNDLPLKGVANRSLTERWRKWRRRKPHMLSYFGLSALTLLVAGAALAFALLHVGYRVEEARQAVAEGQEYVKKHRYADALNTLKRGLARLENLPGTENLKEQLTSGLDIVNRAQVARQLHEITDKFRVLYGVDTTFSARFQGLEADCRAFWEQRERIVNRLGSDLGEEIQRHIRPDLLDLAILGSSLRVRLAPPDRVVAARREALHVLDQAEILFKGSSAVLCHERRIHAEALGLTEVADAARRLESSLPPRTAWEHYALGRALMQEGDLDAAARELGRAVAMDRDGLWPNFYQGICNYRLGRFVEAIAAFTVCTTKDKQNAGCFFNRALAFADLGLAESALNDFESAMKLDPAFAYAALNQATTGWQQALAQGASPISAHFHLALICLARKDNAGAVGHLKQCQDAGPLGPQASLLLKTLQQPR